MDRGLKANDDDDCIDNNKGRGRTVRSGEKTASAGLNESVIEVSIANNLGLYIYIYLSLIHI